MKQLEKKVERIPELEEKGCNLVLCFTVSPKNVRNGASGYN